MAWGEEQARYYAQRVMVSHKNVWDWVNVETREALIAAQCLAVITSQVSDSIRVEDCRQLHRDMLTASGLASE